MSPKVHEGNSKKRPTPPFPKQEVTPPGLEAKLDPRPQYEAREYKGSEKLKNKVALITGGDSGIGRAVANLYAREGANVAIVSLPEEEKDANETKKAVVGQGRKAHLIVGDVTDSNFCQSAVNECMEVFGKLDILVNNAAFQKHVSSIEELELDQWDRTFKTNIYAYFCLSKAALQVMESGGIIINTGSITGLEGSKGLLDYSATKGAIHAFTKSLAQQVISRGIRVNCVAPGPVWTPLNPAERNHEDVKDFGEGTPMGRPAQPEEIAPAYVFFASPSDSSYISGEVLTLLGGNTRAG